MVLTLALSTEPPSCRPGLVEKARVREAPVASRSSNPWGGRNASGSVSAGGSTAKRERTAQAFAGAHNLHATSTGTCSLWQRHREQRTTGKRVPTRVGSGCPKGTDGKVGERRSNSGL